MRLFDLALLLALFSAVMGVFDASDWFEAGEIPLQESGLTHDEIDQMKIITGSSEGDPSGMLAAAWSAWNIVMVMITALYRVLWIWDIIVNTFSSGVDGNSADRSQVEAVAGIIQVGIWMIYGGGLLQLLRKTSIKHMQ